ncbi:twin-arginine translocation signal domain-containing protein [Akkermansiaceae bacterium]|nr:twin-arginine translocation signal domain-containing protein [Akkermansiaceae bacterium]
MTSDRRAFLKNLSVGALGAGAASQSLSAQEKLQIAASPVMSLALAAYSFKPHFAFQRYSSCDEPASPSH